MNRVVRITKDEEIVDYAITLDRAITLKEAQDICMQLEGIDAVIGYSEDILKNSWHIGVKYSELHQEEDILKIFDISNSEPPHIKYEEIYSTFRFLLPAPLTRTEANDFRIEFAKLKRIMYMQIKDAYIDIQISHSGNKEWPGINKRIVTGLQKIFENKYIQKAQQHKSTYELLKARICELVDDQSVSGNDAISLFNAIADISKQEMQKLSNKELATKRM
jgi:hypothetical protein